MLGENKTIKINILFELPSIVKMINSIPYNVFFSNLQEPTYKKEENTLYIYKLYASNYQIVSKHINKLVPVLTGEYF